MKYSLSFLYPPPFHSLSTFFPPHHLFPTSQYQSRHSTQTSAYRDALQPGDSSKEERRTHRQRHGYRSSGNINRHATIYILLEQF